MAIFLASDMHFKAEDPQTVEGFFSALEQRLPDLEAFYLLGDVFEAWAGDEALNQPFIQKIVQRFHAATQKVPGFFLRGNRDFLVGEAFFQATGLHALEDPYRASFFGQPVLLSHGDVFCTEDTAYQAFRAQVRTPEWQAAFLARPFEERHAMVAAYREKSQAEQAQQPLFDVSETAIETAFSEYQVNTLIHGHTHQPAEHLYAEGKRRWVLSEWKKGQGRAIMWEKTTPFFV